MASEWGPLSGLAGEWEGADGVDTAFSHAKNEVFETPYREKATFNPFGPVLNGKQQLYGVDYRTSMWRVSEEFPFHTEVGYWLWDPDTNEILRGFVIPRGITVLAGGTASAQDTTFSFRAEKGAELYNIGENQYLAKNASTLSYEGTITIATDTWSYSESSMLQMSNMSAPFAHTDHNTLHRVG